jgi:hypothetical protein
MKATLNLIFPKMEISTLEKNVVNGQKYVGKYLVGKLIAQSEFSKIRTAFKDN